MRGYGDREIGYALSVPDWTNTSRLAAGRARLPARRGHCRARVGVRPNEEERWRPLGHAGRSNAAEKLCRRPV